MGSWDWKDPDGGLKSELLADGQAQLVDAIFEELDLTIGTSKCPLKTYENDLEFCRKGGLVMDGHRLTMTGDYRHLADVYADDAEKMVLMAGAQTGKSIRVMVKILHTALRRWGSLIGYYFPDIHLPKVFSRARFAPFVESQPEIARWMGRDARKGRGVDAILSRSIGASIIYFLSIKAKTSTEGSPMQAVFFDEVRRMAEGDVQRAMERYSAQWNPIDFKVSTARYPEADIHRYFLAGDQRYFHTACSCRDGVVLSLTFPENVVVINDKLDPQLHKQIKHAFRHARSPYGIRPELAHEFGLAVYRCPKCGDIITDPREGWWQPHNPGRYVHSYQMPQLLSPTFPANRVWWAFNHQPDLMEFYNSKLGLPYVGDENMRCTEEDVLACVDDKLVWPANKSRRWRLANLENCAMGVDVQAGYLVVVIKRIGVNGLWETCHLAVLHGESIWRQLGQLFVEYSCRYAVIDSMPEWDAAQTFAKTFPARVYLATYVDSETGPVVAWSDSSKEKRQKGETRFRWRVLIDRTRGLDWSLRRWRSGRNSLPHPDGLIAKLPKQGDRVVFTSNLRQGRWQPVRIAREVYIDHLARFRWRNTYSDNPDKVLIGKQKWVVEHVGLDPHAGHASLYADVALSRLAKARRS